MLESWKAMSVDLQTVWPQEIVAVNKVRLSPYVSGVPRSLDITGADFRSIDEVLINGITSPDVAVLSKTRLVAQLPDVLQRSFGLTSVTVTSRKLTITPKSFLRFKIGITPGRVQGILRLVQVFTKLLFTTPGTDIFAQRSGGGALKNIGENFGADESGGIISSFIIAVTTTSRQLIAIQGRDPSLPTDEKLLAARVTSAGFNREEGAILASVEITSQAGRAATANLEL